MSICGIYKITEKSTQKNYIGQSLDISKRWEQHLNDNSEGWHKLLHDNPNDFEFSIIEQCLPTELDERERYYIEYFNSYENGFNLTRGNHVNIEKNINTENLNFFYINPIFSQNDINRISHVLMTDSFTKTLKDIIKYTGIRYNKIAYWFDFKCDKDCFIIKIMLGMDHEYKNKDIIYILLDLISRRHNKMEFCEEEKNIKNIWFKYCNEIDDYNAPYHELYHIKNNFGYKCFNFYYMNNDPAADTAETKISNWYFTSTD